MTGRRNTRKLWVAALLIAIFAALTATAFAFFYREAQVPVGSFTVEKDPGGTNVVTVYSESDLRIWARDDRYENKENASPASSRYVLILGADILLSADLLIDRDVSIALNGFTFDLGAYQAGVRHLLAARMVLTAYDRYADPAGRAGSIVGAGKFYYDVPNAVVVFDDVLSKDVYDAETNPGGHFVMGLNEEMTLAEIGRRIDNAIPDGGAFVGDVGLPTEIEPYPYRVEWTASADVKLYRDSATDFETVTNVFVSADGSVSLPPAASVGARAFYSAEASIAYRIVRDSDGTEVAGGAKTVVLLSEGAADAKIAAGTRFLTDYFESYRAAGELSAYRLQLDLSLVSTLRYLGLRFHYSVRDTASGEDRSAEYLAGSATDRTLSLKYPGKTADVTLSAEIVCSYRDGADTVEKRGDLPAEYRFIATDGNNANQAERLTDAIGALIFTKAGDVRFLVAKENYIRYNIESIEYRFENDNGNYALGTAENAEDGGRLYDTVTLLKEPNYEDKIYLTLTIVFLNGAPAKMTVNTRLYYIDPSMGGGGEGQDQFAYYHYLTTNAFLEKLTDGETYVSFTVPTVMLNLIEVRFFLSGDYGERITLTADAAGATFQIRKDLLSTENETVSIRFQYRQKQDDYETGWENVVFYGTKIGDDGVSVEGEPTEFRFDLSGIYHRGSDLGDGLFDILYEKYNRGDLDEERILTNGEMNNPAITELTIGADARIADWTGLGILKYVSTLTIVNPGLNAQAAAEIANMGALAKLTLTGGDLARFDFASLKALTKLKELSVSGTDLSNNADFGALNALTKLSLVDCNIDSVFGVTKLTGLKELSVANNKIRRFDGLYRLDALETFVLYGNVTENSAYGSTGKFNRSELILLSGKGVKVYDTADGTGAPVLLVPTKEEIECAQAVQSIFYRSEAEIASGNVLLTLPETLLSAGGTYGFEYRVADASETLLAFSDGALVVPAAGYSAGDDIEIAVRVKAKDGAEVPHEIYRILEVRIAA